MYSYGKSTVDSHERINLPFIPYTSFSHYFTIVFYIQKDVICNQLTVFEVYCWFSSCRIMISTILPIVEKCFHSCFLHIYSVFSLLLSLIFDHMTIAIWPGIPSKYISHVFSSNGKHDR